MSSFQCTTINALKALTAQTANDQATVLGYRSANDGGGGVFAWSADNTSTDNGGTVIEPSISPPNGRWLRVPSGDINVLTFGAYPNGSDTGNDAIDNRNRIQKAVDWALTHEGKVIFPMGYYLIDGEINIDTREGLIVDGVFGQTDIEQKNTSKGIFDINSPVASEQRFVIIQNLTLRPKAASTGYAIYGKMLTRCQFVNLLISPRLDNDASDIYFSEGIRIEGLDDVGIENCRIRASTTAVHAWGANDRKANLWFDGGCVLGDRGKASGTKALHIGGNLGGVYVDECDVIGTEIGILIDTADSPGNSNREIFLSATTAIDTCTTGVEAHTSSVNHFMATGTWFGTCDTGIDWQEQGGIFEATGCRVANTPTTGKGFWFHGSSNSNVQVSACRFNGGPGTHTSSVAIKIEGNNAVYNVTGNTIQSYKEGIYLGPSTYRFSVQSNLIQKISPADIAVNSNTEPDGVNRLIKDNVGFQTNSTGQATILAGNNSVTFNHGLITAPSIILATPQGDSGMAWHADPVGADQIRIRYAGGNTFGSNIIFSWSAQVYRGM